VDDGRALAPSVVQSRIKGRVTTPSPLQPPDISTEVIDERAVVEAVLAGDRDAFRILVDHESAAVIRACHRVLGDLHEAEDAAQEAFVIAFRSLAAWRNDGPFGAWLTRIAVRIALRRAQRRRDVTWIDPTETSSAAAAGLRSAVSRLDDPYREVIALRFFGELSLDEIATQTGRPLGTVKTHLRRGLIRLRAAVEAGSL